MIDVHHLTQDIVGRNEVGGIASAVRATTEGLSRCWDDCAGALTDDRNPYRLALELTDGPTEPRIEFVEEPDAKSEPELETRLRHLFITTGDDEELAAMQIVVKVLDGLDKRTQNRIITYFSERVA